MILPVLVVEVVLFSLVPVIGAEGLERHCDVVVVVFRVPLLVLRLVLLFDSVVIGVVPDGPEISVGVLGGLPGEVGGLVVLLCALVDFGVLVVVE